MNTPRPPHDPMIERLLSGMHSYSTVVYVAFDIDGKFDSWAFSGFLVKGRTSGGREQWIVATAGHCLEDVQRYIERGYRPKRLCLFDSAKPGAMPVYFHWEAQQPWIRVEEKAGIDCGALDTMTQSQIIAGGKCALEGYGPPLDVEPYASCLYGIPARTVKTNRETFMGWTECFPLQSVADPPELAYPPTIPHYYARLLADVGSMKGLSGGLVFAQDKEGRMWGHAVMRATAPADRRVIIATRLQPFLEMLGEELDRRATGRT